MVSYSFYIVINVHPKDDTDRRKDSDNLNGINSISSFTQKYKQRLF